MVSSHSAIEENPEMVAGESGIVSYFFSSFASLKQLPTPCLIEITSPRYSQVTITPTIMPLLFGAGFGASFVGGSTPTSRRTSPEVSQLIRSTNGTSSSNNFFMLRV